MQRVVPEFVPSLTRSVGTIVSVGLSAIQNAANAAIAEAIQRELFNSTPSAHPAAEKMEPRHQPPDALTREVAAAGGGAPTA